MSAQRIGRRAGLRTIEVGDPDGPLVVVVLHGRMMEAADLAPFAHALRLPALCVFPDAPLSATTGRTWWPVDVEARLRATATAGTLDLYAMDPPGRAAAREALGGLLDGLGPRVVVVGFSQGGMLAMDHALHAATPPLGLALLSSSCIALDDWRPRQQQLTGLPILISHGHADAELAFSAGERLRDFAMAANAQVQWVPFDGGHELPLLVWRAMRRFVQVFA